MSQWTSQYAISRDLAVAQGRIPVGVEGTVGAGDKPPSLNITEETEEEFFKHCSPDADVTAPPDLGLIKQMLDMVRDINVSSDDEEYSNVPIVISKLNPLSSEFLPKDNQTSTPISNSPTKEVITEKVKEKLPKRRQRNVAVESILKALNANKQNENNEAPEPMKLLKPNDFISKNNLEETCEIYRSDDNDKISVTSKPSDIDIMNTEKDNVTPTVVEKVNGWLQNQTNSVLPKKKKPGVTLDASNMFKKKSVTEKVKIVKTIKSPSSSNSGEYKPSMLANEYYQKYVERNKFKETVKDDIWTKAEKRMKEIDEKRKEEAAKVLAQQSPDSTSPNLVTEISTTEDCQSAENISSLSNVTRSKMNRCLDVISLPQHRHLLTGTCIVCQMLCLCTTNENEPFNHMQCDIFE